MRLLVCVVLVVAPVAAAQKPLKPIPAPREATVKAVYFKGRGADATGGTTRVSIRLSPNKSGESSVGVMEEFSGGTGAMWRTATWQAAIGASAFNKVPLTDYEFLVRVGGHIDGPSAGLLMASTFAALQRGKALKPNTTMTGTINPDGSSGPVGGIVQKMRGAAADGVTRFGFPSGGREQLDMTTGERVDLLALAQQLKIEAKELRTLGEAYEFLTGEALPPATLLPESELELTVEEAAGFKLMLQKVELDYQKAFDEALPVFKRNEELNPKYVKAVLEELSGFDERARKYAAQGQIVSAYFERVSELRKIYYCHASMKAWLAWVDNDFDDLKRQLKRASAVFDEIDVLAKEIDTLFPPKNLVNDLYAFDRRGFARDRRPHRVRSQEARADLFRHESQAGRRRDPKAHRGPYSDHARHGGPAPRLDGERPPLRLVVFVTPTGLGVDQKQGPRGDANCADASGQWHRIARLLRCARRRACWRAGGPQTRGCSERGGQS